MPRWPTAIGLGAAARATAISPARPGLRMSAAAARTPPTIQAGSPPACSTRPKPISTMTPLTAISILAAVPISPNPLHRPKNAKAGAHATAFFFGDEAALDDDDLGADRHALVKVDQLLVAHADAARRHSLPDRPGFVRAMDAVERGAEIHGARAQRII